MADTNYFSGIIKILESPQQTFVHNKTLVTYAKGEISQLRQSQYVLLTLWGTVGKEFKLYYKVNDYIIVEGYLSIQKITNVNRTLKNQQKILITCLKIDPICL